MKNQIIKGDCFEILKDFPDNCFDAIITDPPYLYLKHKLDAFYDEQIFIDEAYRLLKKDSMLVFFGRSPSFYKLNYLASQKEKV
jgi:site-specific DNA-methyltransferase (adenine-specific)